MKKSSFLLFALIIALVLCITACSHTHEFDEWITTKQATCTENGEMVRYCSCGEKQTEVVVANGAHIEVVDNAVSPTCTAEGLTEGKHCAICNEIFLAQAVVQKLEHTLDADGVCALCDQPIIPTEGIAYEKSEDGTYAMVVGYDGTASKIKIADTFEGLPVTHIDEYAFFNEVITSVVIPDSVTTIDVYAFFNCSGLTSVVIGDSVNTIGNGAFYCCSSLTSVVIPDSVTNIGDSAFYACSSLTSIEVDENNKYYKSIDENLYTKDGKTLVQYAIVKTEKNFVIPDSVTTIGYGAFGYCTSLTSVVIPDSVTTIGNSAFSGCSSLTSIEVDENNKYYKSIDGNLYTKDGKTLVQYAIGKTEKNFVIPDSVTTIGDSAFSDCSGLTSVVIPDSVTTIGDSAFYACSSLTSVVIPDSVTNIGEFAFYECSGLTSVVIPDIITNIGEFAFGWCFELKDVYYTGSEEKWGEITIGSNNDYLTNATIHYNYVPEE